jgi:hypothetical protein
MIDERYKDATDLHEQYVGNRLEILDGIIKVSRSSQGLGIRVKVFQEKKSQGDDTGKLVELAQNKRSAQTNSQEFTPLP